MSSKTPSSLRIGVAEFPPFTEKRQTRFTGFEIELWEKIAKHLQLSFQYRSMGLKSLIQSVSKGECAVGLAGISKSETREQVIDYTHTTYKTGLSILVHVQRKGPILRSLRHILRQSREKIAGLIAVFFIFIVLSAHIVWLVERGKGAFDEVYVKGLSDAIWFVVATISTVGYGDFTPVTLAGRAVATLLIICGYTFFALVIAELNSLFVYLRTTSSIHEASDLDGKVVVTVKDTITEQLLERYHPVIRTAKTVKEAIVLLEQGEVDAFVFDAPVLQHYLKVHHAKNLKLVGGRFEEHDYGFIVPENSPLLESINRTLLRMIETGEYDALYKKWFTT